MDFDAAWAWTQLLFLTPVATAEQWKMNLDSILPHMPSAELAAKLSEYKILIAHDSGMGRTNFSDCRLSLKMGKISLFVL